MVVNHDVHRVRVEQVSFDVVDEEAVRYAGELVDLAPVSSVVFGHLDNAVVSAGVNQARQQLRNNDVWIIGTSGDSDNDVVVLNIDIAYRSHGAS